MSAQGAAPATPAGAGLTGAKASPGAMAAGSAATGSLGGRLVPLLILLVFTLPVFAALALHALHWRPASVPSRGELLNPPRALPAAGLVDADGHPLGAAQLGERWLLVLALPGRCTAACAAGLDETRRIRVALYRNMGRVARVVLSDTLDPALLAAHQAQPDLLLARPAAGAWRALLPGADPAHAADPAAAANPPAPRLYLVDPLGNLVMRYPPGADPADVKHDLEQLLRYSWNG